MHRIRKTVSICLLFPMLNACGGGGGSDDTASSSPTGVRVLHGAIEGAPVEIFASGDQRALVSAAYNDASVRVNFPKASELLVTERGNPALVMATHRVEPGWGDRFSVLLSDDGYRSWVIPDGAGDMPEGMSAIRLVHGVSQSGELAMSIEGKSSRPVRQGRGSSYLIVEPGVKDIVVEGTAVSHKKQIELEAGQSYTFLIGGEAGYLVTSVLSQD